MSHCRTLDHRANMINSKKRCEPTDSEHLPALNEESGPMRRKVGQGNAEEVNGKPVVHRVILTGNVSRTNINVRKKSILGRRTLGKTPNWGSVPELTPKDAERPLKQQQKHAKSSPDVNFVHPPVRHQYHQYRAERIARQMAATQNAIPKRTDKASKVRLTLLSVASFLPKTIHSGAHMQAQTDQSSHSILESSNNSDMFTEHGANPINQKPVIIGDARLLPSRPSFVELRQIRNRFSKPKLRQIQAWTPHELTGVASKAAMMNYCNQEKTSMIMTWLNSDAPESKVQKDTLKAAATTGMPTQALNEEP